MAQFTVYLITNKVNGKKYVGATKNTLQKRMSGHKSDANKPRKNSVLCKDLRIYGEHNFEISKLCSASTQEDMHSKEKQLIILLGSKFPSGYNLCSGGKGRDSKGYRHTEEAKEKMSRSARVKNTGRVTSEETKQKLREASRRAWSSGKMNNRKKV